MGKKVLLKRIATGCNNNHRALIFVICPQTHSDEALLSAAYPYIGY
jgi:hypothetical protein